MPADPSACHQSHDPSDEDLDGPSLVDCRMLIARIDGTLAALERERALLERRAAMLGKRTDGGDAHAR